MGFWRYLFGSPNEQDHDCNQGQSIPTESVPSDRDLELAAMHNLGNIPFSSEFFPVSEEQLDRNQAWVDQKRTWAESLPDRRSRKAYLGWIDYVQTRINDNRSENQTHKERKAFERRSERYKREWDRGLAARDKIPKP